MDRELVIKFIKYLAWESKVEFNNLYSVLDFNTAFWWEQMYFVWGLPERTNKRCSDDDIKTKRYFYIDIDIRELVKEKTGEIITDEVLSIYINQVIESLDNCWYNDYSAIVNSWNGMHIYYTWRERFIDPTVYRDWLCLIHEEINECIKDLWLHCDPSCVNIARIARLPWSINTIKKDWYNLPPKMCEIIYFEEKESVLFENIELFWEKYKEHNKEEEKDIKKVSKMIQVYNTKNDWWWVRTKINEIPAYEVAELLLNARVVKSDKPTRPFRDGKKNLWIYYYQPYNIIVSHWCWRVSSKERTYTTFEFVCDEIYNWDKLSAKRFFEEKYNIDFSDWDLISKIPQIDWKKNIKWYVYPWEVFDDLDCLMSWELVIICADSNWGKTTFAMDILQCNDAKKTWFYINLEFEIKSVAQSKWLFANDKKKRDLTTNLTSLTKEERNDMDDYVERYLSKFKYYNNHKGCSIEELIDVMSAKVQEWFEIFVIDTLSKIKGFVSDSWIWQQWKIIEALQSFCQSTGACIICLHHTNKNWEFSGTKKIKDWSNVFIVMTRDDWWIPTTSFELTKDKFVSNIKIETFYDKKEWRYKYVSEGTSS